MKKGFWAILCTGIVGASMETAVAMPFELSPGAYTWTTFNFVGQELSSGQNVNGFFSFVTSGPGDISSAPVSVSPGGGSAFFDVDRFFVAEAHLNYDDGRFMNYAQQGDCADSIGGQVGGQFNRSTPCSSSLAPELAFTLDPDLSFLTGYAGSHIPFDVLMSQLLSGPDLHIAGRYGCSGGQMSAGAPADFGSNGYCGGGPDLFGRYSGTLHAVPEPGTLALLGAGMVGFAISRRRRLLPA
jgi:hypothetical protein